MDNPNAIADAQNLVNALNERKKYWESVKAIHNSKFKIDNEGGKVVGNAAENAKTTSEDLDENGIPFVKSTNGTTTFGLIREESGLQPAPIKLSEGFQKEDGKGYGLAHIEANHGEQ